MNDTYTITYGNPQPQIWSERIGVTSIAAVTYQIPGTTRATAIACFLSQNRMLPLASSFTFSPKLAPATAIELEGKPAQQDVGVPTPTPTLSWAAPAASSPVAYRIRIQRLYVDANNYTRRESTLAYLYTSRTSIRIPPGLLKKGDRYVLTLAARIDANGIIDFTRQPYVNALEMDSAEALTGIITIE
jgi:hypothetical protein